MPIISSQIIMIKMLSGGNPNLSITYPIGRTMKCNPPTQICNKRIFPTLSIGMDMPIENWNAKLIKMISLVKETVYSGTFFNHNCNMYGISIIKGTLNMESNKNAIFDVVADRVNALCRLPCPSLFTICGLVAVTIEVEKLFNCPLT